MSLQNLLDLSSSRNRKIGISEERVRASISEIRNNIAFFREYPDLFVDFMQTGGDPNKELTFNLFFY